MDWENLKKLAERYLAPLSLIRLLLYKIVKVKFKKNKIKNKFLKVNKSKNMYSF